jgi:hypothetical protein
MTTTALAPAPMFPGQAAAPTGPCDLTGMYLMHHGFRRDLVRLAAAARRTPHDDSATWKALAGWWRDVAALLHEHHTKEDELLWPVLLDRVDDDGRAVLEAMEDEHHLIDPLLVAVEQGLGDLAGGGVLATTGARERTAAALNQLHDVLDAHLAHEERDAVALIQRHLTAEEWQQLERDGLAAKPPPPLLFFLLPWIAEGLQPGDLAPLLDQAGAPIRVLLRLTRGRYQRRAEKAFAHLTDGEAAA